MKILYFLFLFFVVSSSSLLAETSSLKEQDEVLVLRRLMEVTKNNLQEQEALLKEVIEFKKKKENFITDPTSAKLATSLVLSATRLNEKIEKSHLTHLFSTALLEEIHFFASVGKGGKSS
jgi:hypothetical protein